MIINKKIKRTMMERKSQYLGSLALIIFSCLLYTMFNLLSINMADMTSSFQKNYIQEDANFRTDKRLSNIEELESRFDAKIEETETFDYSVSKDKTLRIFSENTKVNVPAIIKGETLSGGDILIDPAYAKANGIKIGDSIKIYYKDLKVSGFMSLPNYIYPLKSEGDLLTDPNSFGVAVITGRDFADLNKGSIFYSVKFNDNKDSLEDRIAQFKEYLNSQNVRILSWTNSLDNMRITFVTAKLKGINEISTSLPVAILLLTCILTGIVMWRMIKGEFVIIGSLYSFGYRKREIFKHYLIYPLSIALLGGIIGTILGIIALKPMLDFMVSYFNMPVDFIKYDIKYILVSVLLPVIFLCIAGGVVVKKALKHAPVDLMRGGSHKSKVGFLERNLKLDRFKFTTKFKVREQLRSMPRALFLLLGVMLATMLLLFGFAGKSSLDYLMKDAFDQAFKYKYHYVFNTLQKGGPLEGEAFSEWTFTPGQGDKTVFAVYGINSDSQYIMLKDKSGKELKTDRTIVTRPLADKLNIKPGDRVHVVSTVDSKEYVITVDSVAETYVGSYIYMPHEKFNNMLGFPSGSYMGLWSREKLDIPESQLLAQITVDDMRNAMDAMTEPIQATVGAMTFISFIIGLIAVYVVTSLVIEENRGNISLMKVLGYRKKEVYSLILNSSTFMVVLGYILGIPLLLASLKAMFKSVTKDMSISLPVTIDYSYVAAGFVIIYLTYELSKLLSRKKINKISMAEALKAGTE